jgi:Tfp pilus assembly protein PilO
MTRTRQWITIGFVAALLVGVAGWFFAVAPQRSHVSSLRSQTAETVQGNATLQSRLQQLKSQVANVSAEEARIAAIQSKLPAQPALASYIRSLTTAAAGSHVDLLAIAPGAPTAVAAPAAAAQPAAPAATPSAGSGTAAGTAAPAAGAVGAAGAQSAQTAGRPEALQTISVNLTINGDYFAIRDFLAQLEKLPRVTLVTSLNLAPGSPLQAEGATTSDTAQWKTLQGSVSLSIFMATAPQAGPGAVAPGAPAAPTSTAAASN